MDAKDNLDKEKIQLLKLMQVNEKQCQNDSNQPTTETLNRFEEMISLSFCNF